MLDIPHLKNLIVNNDAKSIANYIKKYNITFANNKLIFSEKNKQDAEEYWDKRQLVKKILLNSLKLRRV